MFTDSRSSNLFMQKLQNGRYDRHCLGLAVLETIVFSALAIAFSCGMIGCSTASIAPCTGASCQNMAKADGGESGSDGAASDDASNGGETSNAADASSQFPEFKNSVPQVCDFQNNIPAGLECMKCKYDGNTQKWQGCGYDDLNSPAGNKCTKNSWIQNAPGEWKIVVNMIGDGQGGGYTQACGYGNKQSCDSDGVKPSIPHGFVIACQAWSNDPAFTGCPDGFIFRDLWNNDICLLEDGTTFENRRSDKGSPYVEKGKLWWKDGFLYAGFCKSTDFVDASKEFPCRDQDGNEIWDKYHIYQKISN